MAAILSIHQKMLFIHIRFMRMSKNIHPNMDVFTHSHKPNMDKKYFLMDKKY
jgi:hypothetical protein